MKEFVQKQLKPALWAILAVGLSALFSFLFTDTTSQWYTSLNKPGFMPEPMVFTFAWITLYLLLIIALQRQIYQKNTKAVMGFVVFLTLTALWNYAFFTLQNGLAGLVLLVLCLLAIGYTIWQTWKTDSISTVILIIFLCWIAFATALQFYIYMMN